MEFTDEAILAQRRGYSQVASSFFEKAYFLEKEAALAYQVVDENDKLYRAILLRSAATLALDCGYLWEADYLIQLGLDENIHLAIKDELEEILKEIKKQKQIFGQNEIQITGTVISADAIL